MADSDPSSLSVFRIGDWTFSPAANELHRGEARRKLEHRAARTLELLCRRRGAIVSQEEIVREVWSGRSISANSVPVVISDLRQALGDDAREPRHIETVAKRGYRMLSAGAADAAAPPSALPRQVRRPLAYAFAVFAAFAAAIAVAWIAFGARGASRIVIVSGVVNATGSARYQPLAAASGEVMLADAGRLPGVAVVRAGAGAAEPADSVGLGARLILWSGRPTLMMSAQDKEGRMIWNGMTSGREDLIPSEVAEAMARLPAALRAAED
jgi:DNA-binding winged helix-turn-helix (wHTH) protein